MLVSEFYTAVGDLIGDPSALRTALMLRVANRKLQELSRRYKCKFNLRQGTISTIDPEQTTTYRARSSNVATITTASAHGYRTGEYVKIEDMGGSDYDDASVVIASVPSTTTFTYSNTGDNEGSTADTAGTITLLGRVEYNLPVDFYKPLIGYETTGDNCLDHITYAELRRRYPDFTEISNAVPTHYAIKKIGFVDAQPFAASVLAITTTETITIMVNGRVSGIPTTETFAATSGSHNTTNTWDAEGLISITCATAATAAITITANSAIVPVMAFAVGQKEKQRVISVLYPPPDDAYTLNFDYYAAPEALVNTGDRILIPKPYEEWLIFTTAADILKIDGRKESNEYLQLGQGVFDQMVADEMIEPDEKWTSWPVDYPEEYQF